MFPCFRRASLLLFHFLLLQPTLSVAYSWVLNTPATQCSNLSISITGSDGLPPYRALVVPFGPTPLPGDTEVRSIIDHPFDGNSTTTSFAINYPADSQFVAVVSDARGFGTGGASVATQISDSGDSSCFSVSNPSSSSFFYYVGSDNTFTQCESTRIWWNASAVQGTPNFDGIIPGGQSFTISESNITNSSSEGTGFSWTPAIQGGTTLIVVAGDSRGMGSGGYAVFTVNVNTDGSCLSSLSPSSTPGTPAGAISTSAAVSSSTGTTSAASRSQGTKTGALIGGVVGGVGGGLLLLVGILVCLWRRKASRKHNKGPPIDLLDDPPMTDGITGPIAQPRSGHGDILSYYLAGSSGQTTSRNPSESTYSSPRHNTRPSGLTSVGSGSCSDGYYRPTVIQHADAGLTLLPPAEERIVELPPRYDHIGVRNHPSSEPSYEGREMDYPN